MIRLCLFVCRSSYTHCISFVFKLKQKNDKKAKFSDADAYHEVAEYMDFYNNRRIHSSILDLAPNEFYQRNQTEELTIKEVRV
ncbi:IS3 family transposase [Bacillus subtilis]|nr:IS3 family transposase [Bacillus subtilis]